MKDPYIIRLIDH
jgi:hypothetical protein